MNTFKEQSLVILFVLSVVMAFGSDPVFPVEDIPKELLANAKAIIRSEDVVFTVLSPSKAIKKVKYAVTVLNDNGYFHGCFAQLYDSYSVVEGISGTIYNSKGERVKRITSDDIIDHSAISGSSVFVDNRVKFIDPKYQIYPFTVVYSYEIYYSNILDYPDWMPIPDYNVAVENSTYSAIVPKGMQLRYYPSNLPTGVEKSFDGKQFKYFWRLDHIQAMTDELFSLPIMEVMPVLYIAPAKFEIERKDGNLSTWKDFGKWTYDLTAGRNELSKERVQEIRQLTSNMTDEREIVKVLYEYMQGRTRYVSIQVGIGSWQPFEAKRVDEMSYGDCKALTNYMKSLLDIVGIPSIYSLVRSGANAPRLVKDFPSNQFNHAILCVPLNGDTLWLECTSQKIPFGYLGDMTDDRDVLLVKEDGGVLGRTKTYSAEENSIITKATVELSENGSGYANVTTTYAGIHYMDMLQIIDKDDRDRKKEVLNRINIPSVNLISYSHNEYRMENPEIEERLVLDMPYYCSMIGDRLLVPFHLNNAPEVVLGTMFERRSDIDIRRSTLESDTVIFVLPDGFGVEKLPDGLTIESQFGTYSYVVTSTTEYVRYIRTLKWNKGIYPKEQISSLADFIDDIEKYDGLKYCLKRMD